jgi:hypothetical protein
MNKGKRETTNVIAVQTPYAFSPRWDKRFMYVRTRYRGASLRSE